MWFAVTFVEGADHDQEWELVESSAVMAGTRVIWYHVSIRTKVGQAEYADSKYLFWSRSLSSSGQIQLVRILLWWDWALDNWMSHCDALIAASCWYSGYPCHLNGEGDHYMKIESFLSDLVVKLPLPRGPNLVVINSLAQKACHVWDDMATCTNG